MRFSGFDLFTCSEEHQRLKVIVQVSSSTDCSWFVLVWVMGVIDSRLLLSVSPVCVTPSTTLRDSWRPCLSTASLTERCRYGTSSRWDLLKLCLISSQVNFSDTRKKLVSLSLSELHLLLGLCSMDGLLHQPSIVYTTQWVFINIVAYGLATHEGAVFLFFLC